AAAGDMARRHGLRTSWVTTMLAIAAATLLMGTFPSVLLIAWTSAATFGVSYIAMSGLLLIWGTKVYSDSPAAGVGLAFLALAAGQATGSVAVGVFAETSSQFGFAIATVGALAGRLIRPQRSWSLKTRSR